MLDTLYAATSNAGKLREFDLSASREGLRVLALPGRGCSRFHGQCRTESGGVLAVCARVGRDGG